MSAPERLAAAIHALIARREENPLAGVPVVSTEELLDLLDEDDHRPRLAYHPPLPRCEPDDFDRLMQMSIRLFQDSPLDTPARRRLASAGLRHRRAVAHS
ncbi:hypothetical protein [Nocardiopsis synnemataformans]|uniref:hypothetical protein n=1 Tax=Nocardiopsis synnemataformans TaxID=61305 RepID=UPI003EB70086